MRTIRTLKETKSIPLGMLIWLASISIFIISSDAYASSIQAHSPATIFAAACATCHGGKGLGGVTFVKNGPSDKRVAPKIAGKTTSFTKSMVRNGSWSGAMPAFGPEEITDAELNALATWLQSQSYLIGVPAPSAPSGTAVRLDILDADPWYSDGGLDNGLDPGDDVRRVALGPTEYLKVVNTGRTWHTFTNSALGKDSGFVGYAGNYKDAIGDLNQGQPDGIGYYYADQTTGLQAGCNRYLCKLHPYMQVEVCTSGNTPAGPTAPLGLTRAHKHPMALPPVPGVGAVWVTAQSQEEVYENTTAVINNSVADMDGAYQVIDAADWSADYVANVGNNPHNAWPGTNAAGSDVVLSANWHDNSVTLMDANFPYTILKTRRSGAATAHIQVTPGSAERFYVTHMGGRALQEIDVNKLALGQDPNVGGTIKGATAPHGLWFCGDGVHVLTADTLGNSATLYNINLKTRVTAGSGGKSPLAPSIFSNDCSRGFTNNALTTDISVYNINSTSGAESIARNTAWTANSANWLYKNAAGNIQLRNTTDDQAASPIVPETITQARWVHLPIQTPVSPADSVPGGHGRYMVTANKASFNVSVTALDASGNPAAVYTFPAGLGAHGVTYGKKSVCDDGAGTCYYAYVTNTFEDYVSVYDLEKIENGGMGAPGSALLSESVYVEGGAVAAVAALDPVVASLCDVADLTAGNLTYDFTVADEYGSGFGSFLQCGIGAMNTETDLDYEGNAACLAVSNSNGAPEQGECIPPTVTLYVANLPIGVLCPDCRSGVHVGDIPLTPTTGAPLGGTYTAPLSLTANGAASKYTYLKEEVWVDTYTISCAVDTLLSAGGTLNDCSSATSGGFGGNTTSPGTINTKVELDLHLGINTGGQGIVVRPAATPWP